MVLPEDYFECIFAEFSDSEQLGITSGTCYLMEKGKKIQEKTSKDHTRGGLKTYRRECYDQIEGINETDGWDGIDNITAQMHGWETRSILNWKFCTKEEQDLRLAYSQVASSPVNSLTPWVIFLPLY